jgi:hypothetical protein
VKLAELKDPHPIELAEFAMVGGIADEPAFVWWVLWYLRIHDCPITSVTQVYHTLRRRNAILRAVRARVGKQTHQYRIEVPTSLIRVNELDRINGNTLWMDGLKLEMHNVGGAFEVLEDGKGVSLCPGWCGGTSSQHARAQSPRFCDKG